MRLEDVRDFTWSILAGPHDFSWLLVEGLVVMLERIPSVMAVKVRDSLQIKTAGSATFYCDLLERYMKFF